MYEPVGCCGGLVCLGLLAGLGGVVSPLPSGCGSQVISVFLCFLQVVVGSASVWAARRLVIYFVFLLVFSIPDGALLVHL